MERIDTGEPENSGMYDTNRSFLAEYIDSVDFLMTCEIVCRDLLGIY